MSLKKNTVHQGDCVKLLAQVDAGSVDLIFADPPFNIGYDYDVYDDRQSSDDYLKWCQQWIAGVHRALKPDGTFWLAIGDEYAAELKIEAQRAGFHCRSWVIWYYTFGVNCTNGFSRSHTHLFHFVKDKKKFTFNRLHPRIRVPSARELVYADSRANPNGRLPDNTWITRPQDAPRFLSFAPQHDTWYFARVAGTFKEREGFHGCQMPEQLLARIIRTSSRPNELVLDPFCGSGTTVCVAKKLGRQWMGLELSEEYVSYISQRLDKTGIGDTIDGPEDPVQSAPSTAKGKQRKDKKDQQAQSVLTAAYEKIGYPVDYLLCDKDLNEEFIKACLAEGIGGSAYLWNRYLLGLRKAGKLPNSTKRAEQLSPELIERLGYAAEAAWRLLAIDYRKTLDDILCSPDFAADFDELAREMLPSDSTASSVQLRQVALSIRKRSHEARASALEQFEEWTNKRKNLPSQRLDKPLESLNQPGVFLLCAEGVSILACESQNMRMLISRILSTSFWKKFEFDEVKYVASDESIVNRYALKAALVIREHPPLNCRLLMDEAELEAV